MTDLADYRAASGALAPVWTLEIQTIAADVDRILDAVMRVHPLSYGRYQRTASFSAVGYETAQPLAGSTTETHQADFAPGGVETYPMVELKISIERDLVALARVMDAILDAHHYEEPVIFIREDWASRAHYNPNSDNPNRWWNDGRGLPDRIGLNAISGTGSAVAARDAATTIGRRLSRRRRRRSAPPIRRAWRRRSSRTDCPAS